MVSSGQLGRLISKGVTASPFTLAYLYPHSHFDMYFSGSYGIHTWSASHLARKGSVSHVLVGIAFITGKTSAHLY